METLNQLVARILRDYIVGLRATRDKLIASRSDLQDRKTALQAEIVDINSRVASLNADITDLNALIDQARTEADTKNPPP